MVMKSNFMQVKENECHSLLLSPQGTKEEECSYLSSVTQVCLIL